MIMKSVILCYILSVDEIPPYQNEATVNYINQHLANDILC